LIDFGAAADILCEQPGDEAADGLPEPLVAERPEPEEGPEESV